MSETDRNAQRAIDAARYLRENFLPEDRLATVLVNQREHSVIQRLASAERIGRPDYLARLQRLNEDHYEVYISMNALRPDSLRRTKEAVSAIRHIYLDLDESGSTALANLLKRDDLPRPNYIINSSPDKWQVVWRVAGFEKNQAEELQRRLARAFGADPAATDCARVLRLPGFYNHKYARPFMVRAEAMATDPSRPGQFPELGAETRITAKLHSGPSQENGPARSGGRISQSERDWAFAMRALARGEADYLVAAAIASHRRFDKYCPQDYGARTVAKAKAALLNEPPRTIATDWDRS